MFSNIKILLAAAHLCPALLNADKIVQCNASYIFASSQIIMQFFPPNSNDKRFKSLDEF